MACNQMINEITLDRLIGCIRQIGTESEGVGGEKKSSHRGLL